MGILWLPVTSNLKMELMIRLTFLLALFLVAACSTPKLSPFTTGLMEQNGWDERDLSRIQFYLSDDIVLERQIRDRKSKIERGEIIMRDGRELERLVFPKGTQGTMVRMISSDKMAVSFEPGKDDRFLVFVPHPKRNNTFILSAQNWQKGQGQMNYAGQTYFTVPGSGLAALMVQVKGKSSQNVKQKTVEGRSIK